MRIQQIDQIEVNVSSAEFRVVGDWSRVVDVFPTGLV